VLVLTLLLALVFGAFLFSICLGSVKIPIGEVFSAFFYGGGHAGEESETLVRIVMDIRAPRALLAFFSGGALALSGYLLQTFFRNPIAGPYVLGISSGAKLAVSLALIISIRRSGSISSFVLILAAFSGALFSTFLILLFSLRIRSMAVLLVAGIMVGYIASAGTDLLFSFSDDAQILNLHGWSQGSFSGARMGSTLEGGAFILILLLLVFLLSKPIGAYQNGEVYAKSMGIPVRSLQLSIIVLSSLLSGSVTAIAGPVSFVGIAVPFLARKMLRDHRPIIMIPALFLAGGLFTELSDLLSRMLISPAELSLSSVTSLIGAPIVLVMMLERRRSAP
jgi:iron complex transport system permease protein